MEERCGDGLDHIHAVTPKAERDDFKARYKQAAGFAMEALNGAAPILAMGARVSQG